MVFEDILTKKRIKKESFNILDYSFLIVAIILIILGIYIANGNIKLANNSIETTATLEKIEGTNKYLLKYQLEDGNYVESYSLYNDVIHFFNKTENIPVLYDKDNPEKAIVKSFVSIYGVGFFSCLIGIILILSEAVKLFRIKILNR